MPLGQKQGAIQGLVNAAILAPSGDNMQPWAFAADGARRQIAVSVDPSRDTSPMNAGQRMARIAVGAAIENMLVTAKFHGCEASVDSQAGSSSTVVIQCADNIEKVGNAPELLRRRVTNRRLYEGKAISSNELVTLEQRIAVLSGIRMIWVTERSELTKVADAIGRADAAMFGIRAIRKAFLDNVRFDRPAHECVETGLSLSSLELGWSDKLGLKVLGIISDRLFRVTGIAAAMQRKTCELVRSSGGACVMLCDSCDPQADFQVGRSLQHTWLSLTAANYAIQPMMSLPVLDNLWRHDPTGLGPLVSAQTAEIINSLQPLLKLSASERIAAILRFGHAPTPSGRTGRRKTGESLVLTNQD